MKIKLYDDSIKFKGKLTKGSIFKDGSGFLLVQPKKYIHQNALYCEESGRHKERMKEIKQLYLFYRDAYRELKKELYIPKDYKNI